MKLVKKISVILPSVALFALVLTSCGGHSSANKEQIEQARQDAKEMTSAFEAAQKAPAQKAAQDANAAPVTIDTASATTEIVVSESR
jgi:hypothetical protein